MADANISVTHAVLVEEEVQFTLVELSHACGADSEQLVALVEEGVLTPVGDEPHRWRFADISLRRARAALRLRGKGIPGNPPGDLYVVLSIALPAADTAQAQEAYRGMARIFSGFDPRRSPED